MIKNYLLSALRRFWRQRVYTIINILGLSSGLAVAIVMLLTTRYHLSFDKFHENGLRTHLVQMKIKWEDQEWTNQTSNGALCNALLENYPEIEQVCRLRYAGELLFTLYDANGNVVKKVIETQGMAVDSTFWKMFTFPVIIGDANTSLIDPYSIVLSETLASNYFGDENPIGKIIRINNSHDFKVTAIMKDVPNNSHYQFDFVIPVPFLSELGVWVDSFNGNPYYSYIMLNENSSKTKIDSTITDYYYTIHEPDVECELILSSLDNIHYSGEELGFIFIPTFGAIGLFILILACINYINLTTATSLNRLKEIAIRKVNGARRRQLNIQLIGESVLITFIALNVAFILTELIMDLYNVYADDVLSFDFSDGGLMLQIFILTLATGILSGIYPAMFISRFKPVNILGKSSSSKGNPRLRRALVIFQFVLVIIFMCSTILVYYQYQMMRINREGVDVENVIYMPSKGEIHENYDLIKQDLLKNPDIEYVTRSSDLPTYVQIGEFQWGLTNENQDVLCRVLWVGYDFLETFKIDIVSGRFYDEQFAGDMDNSIIINTEAAKVLGLDDPVGEKMYLYDRQYVIVGVIDYFNFFPIELGGKALIMKLAHPDGTVFIRHKEGTFPYAKDYIKSIFEKHNSAFPYEVNFYEDFENPIEAGLKGLHQALFFFTLFGIFIAVLGLLGLVVFVTQQKAKEIGIRKAVGASIPKIIMLVSKEFLRLVIIANVIAIPISYFLVGFTQDFFTVELKLILLVYIGVGTMVFLISFLSIFLNALRAALANPANSLRYE